MMLLLDWHIFVLVIFIIQILYSKIPEYKNNLKLSVIKDNFSDASSDAIMQNFKILIAF